MRMPKRGLKFERWEPIPRTGGVYDVSSWGNVRSWAVQGSKNGSKAKKPSPLSTFDHHGYRMVNFVRNGKWCRRFVHRLVLEAFCGDIPSGADVAHLDGDRTNNALWNLAMVHRVANEYMKRAHGTYEKILRNLNKEDRDE